MSTITVLQTPVFGATTGYKEIFKMEDMPFTVGEEVSTLEWLFSVLNDYDKMEQYGCPSTMRSLSVGDIVTLDAGFGVRTYQLTANGWATTVLTR